MQTDEPFAVIRGLRDGSRDAWAALYDQYCEAVWRYVARLLGPNAAAVADVVQETFLAAARAARSFDPARGTIGGWLIGIAHNRIAIQWRQTERAERLRKLAESGAANVRHWLDERVSHENGTTADFDRFELADLVRGILAEMSAEYAAMLAAKYLDERTLEQIACEYDCSVEAVKSRLARARREFRTKFEQLSGDAPPAARPEKRMLERPR